MKKRHSLQPFALYLSIGLSALFTFACAPPPSRIELPAKQFDPSSTTSTEARPATGLLVNDTSAPFRGMAGEVKVLQSEGLLPQKTIDTLGNKELLLKLMEGTGWNANGKTKPKPPSTQKEKEQEALNKKKFMDLLLMPIMSGLFRKYTANYSQKSVSHKEMHCGTCHGEGQKLTVNSTFDFSTPSKLFPLSRNNPMATTSSQQAKVAIFMATRVVPMMQELLGTKVSCFHCHASKP